MSDPTTYLRDTYPKLFNKGVELLTAKADAGDERAIATIADIKGANGAAFIQIEGGGDVYLGVTGGAMTASEAAPDGLPVNIAVAGPAEALAMLIAEAENEGVLEDDRAAIKAAQTASKRLEDMLSAQEITLHLTVTGVPDLGDVTLRIGLGVAEPPAEGGFTATLTFDDLESIREGTVNVQAAFMGGKIRLAGNYAPAMALAMQLMQPPT